MRKPILRGAGTGDWSGRFIGAPVIRCLIYQYPYWRVSLCSPFHGVSTHPDHHKLLNSLSNPEQISFIDMIDVILVYQYPYWRVSLCSPFHGVSTHPDHHKLLNSLSNPEQISFIDMIE
eukprot:sb/3476308/